MSVKIKNNFLTPKVDLNGKTLMGVLNKRILSITISTSFAPTFAFNKSRCIFISSPIIRVAG